MKEKREGKETELIPGVSPASYVLIG